MSGLEKILQGSDLEESAVIQNFRITAGDDKKYYINRYSLRIIIVADLKVDNDRAMKFHKWANSIVKDYTIQAEPWTTSG